MEKGKLISRKRDENRLIKREEKQKIIRVNVLGGQSMINNDKNNSLTKTITSIAQEQIKKGDVQGIYLKGYRIHQKNKIEIVSVVESITREWENLWKNQYYTTMSSAKVHNIEICPTVVPMMNFSKVYMHSRETLLAQELKNSHIIYDVEPSWYNNDLKLLADLQESYMKDDSLTFFKNRLVISPKLIKKIKDGLKCGKPVQLSRENKRHIQDKEALTTQHKIYQILELLTRYDAYEKEDGCLLWNDSTSSFDPTYIACDINNLRIFQRLQQKTTASKYSLEPVFMEMRKTQIPASEEKRKEFFGECLSYLVQGFEKINPLDYLEGEEKIYQELWTGKKPKRK